ncbi:MAG: GxxExxY protein [Spirochaetales bacterium]|nr:GxxExxY protein [Spirochaetales bacterium]
MELEYEDLTQKIIGAAIDVHKELGPGFLESVYENSLAIELQQRHLEVVQQKELRIFYKGYQVGMHRTDLIVEDKILIELKAIKSIENIHFAIARSCLKACNLKHGLILNFNTIPLEIKRVIVS